MNYWLGEACKGHLRTCWLRRETGQIEAATNYRLNGKSPFGANWSAKRKKAPESRVRRPNLVDAVIAALGAVFVLEERRI